MISALLCGCHSSSSCFDPEPASGSTQILGGSPTAGDAGAVGSDAGNACANVDCGPGGVCNVEKDPAGVSRPVCLTTC